MGVLHGDGAKSGLQMKRQNIKDYLEMKMFDGLRKKLYWLAGMAATGASYYYGF